MLQRASETPRGGERGALSNTPQTLGPYRVICSLGAGGMGEVWLAYDPQLDRQVAIKRVRPDAGLDPERRARFQREARLAAALNHAAIVKVHHLVTEGDADHIVMEYVPGTSLRQRLREHGPFPPAEGLAVAATLADGLAYAHRQGVVHRDLKTENVLLTPDNEPKLTDFGIARRVATEPDATRDAPLTHAGTLLGTYRAMSPEHICGDPVDERSDLFSFGVLLYELFTADSPFLGASNQETMQRVLRHRPPPIDELAGELPPALADLVDQLLEKDPLMRPRGADEVAERLRALSDLSDATRGTGATPPTVRPFGRVPATPPSTYSPVRRRRGLVAALVLLALASAAWFVRDRLAPPAPPAPLYVAVAAPTGDDPGEAATELLALAVHNSLTRTLVAFEGVAPRATEAEAAGTPAEIARAAGADEVLVSHFACQARHCLVELSRVASDGRVLWSDHVPVPLDEPLLAAKSIRVLLLRAYPELSRRSGLEDPAVRPQDYEAFLAVRQEFDAGVGGAALADLLERAAAVRRSSSRFTETYLLEAQIALRHFHAIRDPALLERAFELVGEAQELAPADPDVLFNRVHCEIIGERLAAAEATLTELEKLVPGDVRILAMRARIFRDRGESRQALALLRTAVDRRPSAGLLIDYGRLAFQEGEAATAREAVRRHLELAPASLSGRRLQATIEMHHGDPERAVEILEALVAQFADPIDLTNLGLTYLLLGRYDRAAEAFERAEEAAPHHFAMVFNLADARLLQSRRAEAESLYRRVVELVADGATAQELSVRAQALAHLGAHREAVAAIHEALARQPGSQYVAYEAAVVCALVGDRTAALVNVEKAIRLGYQPRWFALPWFDDLRAEPEFRKLTGGGEKTAP